MDNHPASCGQSEWTFHESELAHDDVRALIALHIAEMKGGSPPSACHVLPADTLADPAIRFVTLRAANASLLGIGALKTLSPDHGELKSMRTAPDALGQGVGSAMLVHLIAQARNAGMTRLSLETGNVAQFDAANRLYLRHEFVACGPFVGYAPSDFTLFYTRNI